MTDFELVREFVSPYYKEKDIMHDLTHIDRVINSVNMLIQHIDMDIDYNATIYAAYFHGFVYKEENTVMEWLISQGFSNLYADKIITIAWESQKEENAMTNEGKLLHDAHMIEGGKTFLVVKSLITGSVRGQTLEETIQYFEDNVINKGTCYLDKSKEIHVEAQTFAKHLIEDLKLGIRGYI